MERDLSELEPLIRQAYQGGAVFDPKDPGPVSPRIGFRSGSSYFGRGERVTKYPDGKIVRGRQP